MTKYLSGIADQERSFHKAIQDVIFHSPEDAVPEALDLVVWGSQAFRALPRKHQHALKSYAQGLIDGTSYLLNSEAPVLVAPPVVETPPKTVLRLQPEASWRRHANGGGWVSSTAYVAATAHVGSKAVVFGNARLLENSRAYGMSRIGGNVECYGACHIHGLAVLTDHVVVKDSARILGKVWLGGGVTIGGRSLVRGDGQLSGGGIYIDEKMVLRPESLSESGIRELGIKRATG